MQKKKIGFFLIGFWGHSIPLLKIADYLSENFQKYDVEVHAPEMIETKVKKAYPNLNLYIIHDGLDENSWQAEKRTFSGPGKIINKQIPQRWEKYFSTLPTDFDLIMTDMFNPKAASFAKDNEIKLLVNHPASIKNTKQFFNLLDLQTSFSIGGFTISYSSFFYSLLTEILGINKAFFMYQDCSTILINSFFGFDEPIPLPPNIRPVGMLEKSFGTKLQDEELLKWMQKKNEENKKDFMSMLVLYSLELIVNLQIYKFLLTCEKKGEELKQNEGNFFAL